MSDHWLGLDAQPVRLRQLATVNCAKRAHDPSAAQAGHLMMKTLVIALSAVIIAAIVLVSTGALNRYHS
jgi:hypothetical protein